MNGDFFGFMILIALVYFGLRNFIYGGWAIGKICPNCRNRVNSHAKVCQFCHSQLD
jgi:hypothetical protein